SCPTDELVLQVPARALLEGDTVTLRCRGQWNRPVTRVRFYHDKKDLGGSLRGTELSLSPLQLNHSGSYHCRGVVGTWTSRSPAVTVTVHGEHPTAGTPI
ncbi:FCGR3 protein, partial [Loxia curvirostra]|nr:FCGR3 protein [Loxia curvirostra]